VLRIRKLTTAHYFSQVTDYHTPPHSHDAWEFVFCSHGHVRTFQGSEERVLKTNQILLHPPRMMHHLQIDEEATTFFVLAFTCNSESLKLLQQKILRVNQSQRRMLMMIMQELGNAFELQNPLTDDSNPDPKALRIIITASRGVPQLRCIKAY